SARLTGAPEVMFGLPLAFAAPAVLVALAGLGALYYLLRVTPPTPRRVQFPPMRLLLGLAARETEPARTPWPILALRLAVAALIIIAMAQPLWRNLAALTGSGPLLILIDDGWPAAPTFDQRIAFARQQMAAAARAGRTVAVKAFSEAARDITPLNEGEIEGRLRSLAPVPYAPPREAALSAIERFLTEAPSTDVVWIADGVELGGAGDFASRLAHVARSVDVVTDGTGARALRFRRQARGRRPLRLAGRTPQRGAKDRRRRRSVGRRDLARRRPLAPKAGGDRFGDQRRLGAAADCAELLSLARARPLR